MNFEMPDFMAIVPEIFVLSMACLVLVVDVFLSDARRMVTYTLAQLTLVGALVLTLWLDHGLTVITFGGTFVTDPMAVLLKVFIYIVTFGVFVYSRGYLQARDLFKGEFYVLGLFGVLGMTIMVSAHSFLTIYLGLELLSLSLYAMVAFNRDSYVASEAAMKYFVLGALASGMLLYGMSILYGVTASLDIGQVSDYIAVHHLVHDLPLLLALS
ncbi:MAG: proton-conducting transporter membrane subunit, partial [Gammaproteobacteria bacterium]